MRRGYIIRVVVAGLMLMGGVFSFEVYAATREVDRLDDSGAYPASLCTTVPQDCTLRNAVQGAANGDTITFKPGLTGTIQLSTQAINIVATRISIVGPGPSLMTVQGNDSFMIFTTGLEEVRISGLRLANSMGGLRANAAGSTNFDYMSFDNLSGSAIDSKWSGSLIINNSVFTNNGAKLRGSGGAILAGGGGMTITSSTFSGNQHGAIYVDGVKLDVADSSFTGNTAVTTDSATGDGGAINSRLSAITINRSTFIKNSAQGAGGAICVDEHFLLRNSVFVGNTATGDGGAIFKKRSSDVQQFRAVNTTFSGNRANGNGGAIYLTDQASFFRHVTVSENSAGNTVGGIRGGTSCDANPALCDIANSIVTGNTAPNVPDTSLAGNNNIIGGDAGLYPLSDQGGPTPTYALKSNSPAIDAGNKALSVDVDLTPLKFDQRGLPRSSGISVDIGAYERVITAIVTNASDDIKTEGSLRKAIADATDGGVILFDPAFFGTSRTISVSGEMLINKALTINGPSANRLILDANSSGRIFNITAKTLNLAGMTLTRGFAGDVGGCLSNQATVNLSDAVVTNCRAGSNGGAIGNYSTMTITRSTVTGGTAIQGGGIWNFGNLSINNSTISANTATRPPQQGSAPAGGGISNSGDLYFMNSTLSNNSAQLGGGLYNLPGTGTNGYVHIRNSTISDNAAINTGNPPTADGGGIYADGTYKGGLTATIDAHNLTMSNNTAVNSGGGMFMHQDSGNFAVSNLSDVIIGGNSAGAGPDISGQVISYGYNLIGNTSGSSFSGNSPKLTGNILNPLGGARLAPLANFGGPTQTLALFPNSPAVGNGDPASPYPTDQRGAARPLGAAPDIGAFELIITLGPTTLPNGAVTVPYNQTLTFTRLLGGRATNSSSARMAAIVRPGVTFFMIPITGQSLPPGLVLNFNGTLSGTPTQTGAYTFSVRATDTDGMAGVQQFTLTITP